MTILLALFPKQFQALAWLCCEILYCHTERLGSIAVQPLMFILCIHWDFFANGQHCWHRHRIFCITCISTLWREKLTIFFRSAQSQNARVQVLKATLVLVFHKFKQNVIFYGSWKQPGNTPILADELHEIIANVVQVIVCSWWWDIALLFLWAIQFIKYLLSTSTLLFGILDIWCVELHQRSAFLDSVVMGCYTTGMRCIIAFTHGAQSPEDGLTWIAIQFSCLDISTPLLRRYCVICTINMIVRNKTWNASSKKPSSHDIIKHSWMFFMKQLIFQPEQPCCCEIGI